MNLHRLPPEDAAIRRYVEELWLPYQRNPEATVDAHELADIDRDELVDAEAGFRRERLESEDYRAWIAVDDGADGENRNASDDDDDGDDVLVGFITTEFDESPTVFDRPDRLVSGDFFVREPYRGTGLASDLVDRVAERARDELRGTRARRRRGQRACDRLLPKTRFRTPASPADGRRRGRPTRSVDLCAVGCLRRVARYA